MLVTSHLSERNTAQLVRRGDSRLDLLLTAF